jgi:hypothetical protein
VISGNIVVRTERRTDWRKVILMEVKMICFNCRRRCRGGSSAGKERVKFRETDLLGTLQSPEADGNSPSTQ